MEDETRESKYVETFAGLADRIYSSTLAIKRSSNILLVFSISYILWNWKMLYILAFGTGNAVDRIETAIKYSYQIHGYLIYPPGPINTLETIFSREIIVWLSQLSLLTIGNFCLLFLVPIFVTYLYVWEVPKIYNLAHRVGIDFWLVRDSYARSKLAQASIKRTTDYENLAEQAKAQVENLTEIAELEQRIKELEANITDKNENSINYVPVEERWKKEYLSLASSNKFSYLDRLQDVMYRYSGEITDDFGNLTKFSTDAIAFLHTNDLIVYANSNHTRIDLTDKGKYFLQMFNMPGSDK